MHLYLTRRKPRFVLDPDATRLREIARKRLTARAAARKAAGR